MKKTKLLALLLALAMIIGLAPAAFAEGEDVTIKYWSHQRHDREFIESKVEEFNALDNGINIEFQVYTDNFGDMLAIDRKSVV